MLNPRVIVGLYATPTLEKKDLPPNKEKNHYNIYKVFFKSGEKLMPINAWQLDPRPKTTILWTKQVTFIYHFIKAQQDCVLKRSPPALQSCRNIYEATWKLKTAPYENKGKHYAMSCNLPNHYNNGKEIPVWTRTTLFGANNKSQESQHKNDYVSLNTHSIPPIHHLR